MITKHPQTICFCFLKKKSNNICTFSVIQNIFTHNDKMGRGNIPTEHTCKTRFWH